MHQVTVGRPDAIEDAAAEAETLIALGRYEQALASIARSLILDPADSRLHCQRALARQRLGRYRDASRAANEAISAEPDEPWGYDLKASALAARARTRLRPWRQQFGRQARDAARRAVQLAPEDARWLCTEAEAELLAGDWPAARAAAQRAVTLAPDRPQPYVAVAQVALAARDFPAARHAALLALALDPTNYPATNHLGSALVGLGRWRQAAATYARAARLDPGAQPAKRNLARLGMVIAAVPAVAILLLLLLAPYGSVLLALTALSAGTAGARSRWIRDRFDRLGLQVALGLARLSRPEIRHATTGEIWPRPPRPLAGASTWLVSAAAGLGWLGAGLIVLPNLAGRPGRPGGPMVALVPGLLALSMTTVLALRLKAAGRRAGLASAPAGDAEGCDR